jgi:2-iminoacetate synthase
MSPLPKIALSEQAVDFIDDDYLTNLLAAKPEASRIREIIAKSMEKQPLSVEETALLCNVEDPELVEEIFEAARQLKRDVYGNRIVLFAPMYIGSDCVNDCAYCGFKTSNPDAIRCTLTPDQIRSDVIALEDQGHKRLILVFGEHPKYDADFIARSVRTVYETKHGNGEIRRVNINAAPMDHDGFRKVKEAGIGTYQIFQETYHKATYAKVHGTKTRKGDFMWRLDSLDRAFESGCDDVGIGALFGLYDWRFEVMGLVSHSLHLQQRHGVGPHTISFPRLCAASGVDLDTGHLVSDENFLKLIAILRLAVPYTGLILTARETPIIRRTAMSFGVSQIDAGSRIELGGYTHSGDAQVMEKEQFQLGDIRPLDEVIRELAETDYIPSFCTACYRIGRTGEHFMEFAIPGFIQRFCTPNALLTFMEYLSDYASPETKKAGAGLIQREAANIADEGIKTKVLDRLKKIESGEERDLYF